MISSLQSGLHILGLVDYYGSTFVAFNLVIFELITFCYIYGVDRMCKDIKFMLGFTPNLYWRICWKYLTPAFTGFLVVYYHYNYNEIKENELGKEELPLAATLVGYALAFVGLVQLPAIAIYKIYTDPADTLLEVSFAWF